MVHMLEAKLIEQYIYMYRQVCSKSVFQKPCGMYVGTLYDAYYQFSVYVQYLELYLIMTLDLLHPLMSPAGEHIDLMGET